MEPPASPLSLFFFLASPHFLSSRHPFRRGYRISRWPTRNRLSRVGHQRGPAIRRCERNERISRVYSTSGVKIAIKREAFILLSNKLSIDLSSWLATYSKQIETERTLPFSHHFFFLTIESRNQHVRSTKLPSLSPNNGGTNGTFSFVRGNISDYRINNIYSVNSKSMLFTLLDSSAWETLKGNSNRSLSWPWWIVDFPRRRGDLCTLRSTCLDNVQPYLHRCITRYDHHNHSTR